MDPPQITQIRLEEAEHTLPMVMATVSCFGSKGLQFSPCPPVAFISDLTPNGYMTPLFKFLTEQHGAEAPAYNSIQRDLQQIMICGGCICEAQLCIAAE